MEVRPELANSPCSRLPKQKSSAHLPNLSREARLWTTVVDELPSGHSKGGGFSSAALEGSAALPSGAVPRTVQRAPTQERALQKRGETCFCTGSWPACARAFLVSGRWFSGPAPSGSGLAFVLFLFLSFGRGRHVPAPSGRDVGSKSGAPTQEPAFSGIPLSLGTF